MIIIVEGIDRIGKSTLCKYLSEKFDIPVHEPENLISYKNMENLFESDKVYSILKLCKETNCNIIFDRLFFSNHVYGVIERGYSIEEGIFYLNKMYRLMDGMKSLLIYVEPVNIEWSSNKHGRDLSKHAQLFEKVYGSYPHKKIKTNFHEIEEVLDGKDNNIIKEVIELKEG